jgi:hypothetical protein
VLLPKQAPWLNSFVSEVCGFTGVKDRHDDQVDALAAAFDCIENVNVVPMSTVLAAHDRIHFDPRTGLPRTNFTRWASSLNRRGFG